MIDAGFTEVMQWSNYPIKWWLEDETAIRATMQKADIMLMDEPTNHLDVLNVQWVVDYIDNLPNVTCLMVSHDTGFWIRLSTTLFISKI